MVGVLPLRPSWRGLRSDSEPAVSAENPCERDMGTVWNFLPYNRNVELP